MAPETSKIPVPVGKTVLNLFYQNPDPDRWLPGDRFPRRLIRKIFRKRRSLSGQELVFFNLKAGLEKLKIPFRVNDFSYAKKNPEEPVGIIGKSHVVDLVEWKNPILFGAAIMSHPSDDPDLLQRRPIRKILVPGEWMRKMCEPYWGDQVRAWPVGIDTDLWQPTPEAEKAYDFLLYDKVRWEHERYEKELIQPIRQELQRQGHSFREIRYGHYQKEEFRALLGKCKAVVFLCEHETQGLAYQQALSCDVPILAWDRGGFWQDPSYYPAKEKYSPVTSVPYWRETCGLRFASPKEFPDSLREFIRCRAEQVFSPRAFVLENLTLEKCALQYLKEYADLGA